MFPIEFIPLDEQTFLNRHVHRSVNEWAHQESNDKRKFPAFGAFNLREGEEYLSFNWEKYATLIDHWTILSLSKNRKGNWVEGKQWRIYKFPITFLKEITTCIGVSHKPEFNGNPAPIGRPNNRSHSAVYFDVNRDLSYRMNLADFCYANGNGYDYEENFPDYDIVIPHLRTSGNSTSFHLVK